ncbi:MAG: HD domain-containing protein [Thermoguttaceae bacterium]|nr:HD domain-containing protein [Thermoguttaceae bacterium]MBR0190559.1 HD domain-containing protein [Thermoguttaceae bacterium]
MILEIPEIAGLDSRKSILRIPPEVDVPLTPRVRRLIDTAEFRRLASVRQLGFVSLVYPGAMHSRFEHSLGVFRLAAILLKQMAHDADFVRIVPTEACELFLVTSLLHDLGHYPYAHLIEDLRLGTPSHEQEISRFLLDPDCEVSRIIRSDWHVSPEDVLYLLTGKKPAAPTLLSENFALYKLLSSMLSGPVDIDKMDYLQRDSLHAGVPYGRNYDQERLLASLCLNETRDGLAISSKGKTAAELLVFARYVMFSEVYWHHTVRSATAMFQRLYFNLHQTEGMKLNERIRNSDDSEAALLFRERNTPLAEALFGPKRFLYKQIAEFNAYDFPEIYGQIARRPYTELKEIGERLAASLSGVEADEILIDAPSQTREIEFRVMIRTAPGRFRPLKEVSPVVRALAVEQFDDQVKRVRIYVHPRLVAWKEEIVEQFVAQNS